MVNKSCICSKKTSQSGKNSAYGNQKWALSMSCDKGNKASGYFGTPWVDWTEIRGQEKALWVSEWWGFGHKTRRGRSRDREYCQKCISKRFMGCVLIRTFLHYCHHGLQRFVRIYESPCDTWCSLLGRRDSPLCLTGSVAATAHNLSSSTSSWSSRWKGQAKLKQSFFFGERVNVWSKLVEPHTRWPKLNCKSQGYLLWLPPNSFGVSQSVNLNLKLRRGKSSLTAVLAARVC